MSVAFPPANVLIKLSSAVLFPIPTPIQFTVTAVGTLVNTGAILSTTLKVAVVGVAVSFPQASFAKKLTFTLPVFPQEFACERVKLSKAFAKIGTVL